MKKRNPLSLRMRLLLIILACWVLPILLVMSLAGILVRNSYEQSLSKELQTRTKNAMEQLEMRLDAVFEESKSVSYDGVVRNSYRRYETNGDSGMLYRTVNEYLNQNFTRDEKIPATFISFWDDPEIHPYAANRSDYGYHTQKKYLDFVERDLLGKMKDKDTKILLEVYDGTLYVARNLLSSQLRPYATVVFQCDARQLFVSLDALQPFAGVNLMIDDHILLDSDGVLSVLPEPNSRENAEMSWFSEVEGHKIKLDLQTFPINVWADTPRLRQVTLLVMLLALPMLAAAIWLFHRLVGQPVDILMEAEARLQSGERGFQITEQGRSREFQALFDRFNLMSSELNNQFERSYKEQQALQQAKIKALQSQINPHFLNNTLETINWEARIAGNDRVSAMIEALSVMLDAALDRGGNSLIRLQEELSYVDAYLYIIRERLGERLEVEREIDNTLMDFRIPRLILQPIVENAVEHDISPHRGGKLSIRIHREGQELVLEVEHDGVLTGSDIENINSLMKNDSVQGGEKHVGLLNVKERLALIYGENGRLLIEQCKPDKILASIRFPVEN